MSNKQTRTQTKRVGQKSRRRRQESRPVNSILVVVMGLTWIFGVLIVEVEELVPLAYIYTIMVAFQGLFIFLIFVVFPKEVREVYVKLYKNNIKTFDTFTEKDTGGVGTGTVAGLFWCGWVVTGSLRTEHVVTGSLHTEHVVTGSLHTEHVVTGSLHTEHVETGSLRTGSVHVGLV